MPSGIRVILERNYWGIDVTIYAPRTASRNDEEGLCLYRNKALDGDMNTYGYRYRYLGILFLKKYNSVITIHCACISNSRKKLL